MPTNVTKPIILDETGRKIAGALELIAEAQMANIHELTNWYAVQQIVREGLGPDMLPVGSQLKVPHETLGTLLFDVAGHDIYRSPFDSEAHTMVLLMHDCINGRQADAAEAIYYAENGLAAGTYNFTLLPGWDVDYGGGGTYQFTLSQAVPEGGQLVFPWAYNTQAVNTKVSSYASASSATAIESVSVISGSGGTSLGVANGQSTNVNHGHRARYGSNHWGESAIRQWLNSDAAANAWWHPTNKYDRPATYANVAGFLNGIDAEFLAVVGAVDVTCRTNGTYELDHDLNTVYTTRDKFFLASRVELGYGAETSINEGSVWPLFDGAENVDRIKYDHALPSTARYWWLRSPYPGGAYFVRYVNPDGSLSSITALNGYGAAPACVIY